MFQIVESTPILYQARSGKGRVGGLALPYGDKNENWVQVPDGAEETDYRPSVV